MIDNISFLPGMNQQADCLIKAITLKNCSILVIGSGSEAIAVKLRKRYESLIYLAVQESESLLTSRIILGGEENIIVKLMDFEVTDFKDSQFDLVYAQASISNNARNKIIKEIKRILKPAGYFCAGEIVSFSENQPKFISDMFENSGISPLHSAKINDYYSSKGFQILFEKDLSYTLKDFYMNSIRMLKDAENNIDEGERSFYKKLVKKINHESNIYLQLGGDKFYGFKMLILKKEGK
ncbi:MAG TPA: methyltransferase domain-containing protein [Ignavibacteriaceae bacterium]|nr:methyltransferase domain-containing protein [Ignavibacteriaceae bacterium]